MDPDDWLIPDDPARTAGPGELDSDNEDHDDEPDEDGECFRGGEAEAYNAEQQEWIYRNLK